MEELEFTELFVVPTQTSPWCSEFRVEDDYTMFPHKQTYDYHRFKEIENVHKN